LTRFAIPRLCYGGVFDWDTATKRLDELTALSERPDFWNDPAEAQKLMRERQKLADGIATVEALEKEIADAPELMELAEGDAGMLADIQGSLARAADKAQKAELAALLSDVVEAGERTLEWDGRDDGGRPVASGSYLARLRADGQTATHKMVLAK